MTDRMHNRPKTRELIEAMLREREPMLVKLWKLSGRESEKPEPVSGDELTEFMAVLMDYIAAGHFGLYQRIADGSERREPVVELAKQLYQRIAQTTEAAVDFNDKYEGMESDFLGDSLPDDLVSLAEGLSERIDLEDQLIEAMLGPRWGAQA